MSSEEVLRCSSLLLSEAKASLVPSCPPLLLLSLSGLGLVLYSAPRNPQLGVDQCGFV